MSAAGPFDMWPTGLGFEYFFGFMAAETNQFTPALYRGITPVPTLEEGALDKALADAAIHWLRNQQAAATGKPVFMYYAPGPAHAGGPRGGRPPGLGGRGGGGGSAPGSAAAAAQVRG